MGLRLYLLGQGLVYMEVLSMIDRFLLSWDSGQAPGQITYLVLPPSGPLSLLPR